VTAPARSPRRDELLERAYAYVLEHGLAELSLRPLARAIGSSPRVLLFLFESKEALVRALLARARRDELEMLERLAPGDDPVDALWGWLSAPEHRPLLTLWVEAYARSLTEPHGPWGGFARDSVETWRRVLGGTEPEATRTLAVLRGALLDLLATGDIERTTAAVPGR
jgi:AcrR family transcriptional regulator